jgi:hypothetical protein
MKKHLRELAALAAGWLPDALMAAGTGGISYGAWLVYQPAGFIVGGAFLLAAGVLAARKVAA